MKKFWNPEVTGTDPMHVVIDTGMDVMPPSNVSFTPEDAVRFARVSQILAEVDTADFAAALREGLAREDS